MERVVTDKCQNCGNEKRYHYSEEGYANPQGKHCLNGKTCFVPVVVWELSEAEVKLLKEAKK